MNNQPKKLGEPKEAKESKKIHPIVLDSTPSPPASFPLGRPSELVRLQTHTEPSIEHLVCTFIFLPPINLLRHF
ncbi:hypothetical protein LR48_Vigan05g117000 [Vigna angularis]|uniref:Uncharacterized protein n=1 Tax=Phaseolus angularis TaxID=3914 RepID=A0A0L9UL09_PHAAN|nr:hypothetical protein LR48_Vigan05g117000 [Vigna angularis]